MYCNGGKQLYNLVASLNVFPIEVHFKKDSMANIVSMKSVSKIEGAHVTMDKKHDLGMSVKLENGDFSNLNRTRMVCITLTSTS